VDQRLQLSFTELMIVTSPLFYRDLFSRIGFAFWGVARLRRVMQLVHPVDFREINGILCLRISAQIPKGDHDRPLIYALEALAEDMGYENADAIADDSELYDLGIRAKSSKTNQEEEELICCIGWDIRPEGSWSDRLTLTGTIGKVKSLPLIEEKVKSAGAYKWELPGRIFQDSRAF
jgi:hypothetical protein